MSLGLLSTLLCLSACSAEASSPPSAQAALPGYEAPDGASALCAGLAGSTHFLDIPAAMGQLTSGVGAVDGRSRLAAARGELRSMVDGLPAGEDPDLRAAADGVIAALLAVLGPELTDEARADVLASMDEFVAQLQPACGFPA
ncbi:hypothetical protein DQ244_03780 [Blastococcus sp. TBT05-19]|uniref:hypothetical protein n=1 Tax=Blastococcus sp. TBT05-19 TaxID=2250581 RepID=UPI000DE96A65|nr:hypothetical protein [Blastococcus sp. TBT05-19]RBY94444.1 hypothetical protein DQ244_03780 [Blastococcus sp. TBT05-19]